MAKNYPKLRILPLEDLLLHEWHDEQRARPLAERLRASGVLRNPPIVTPLMDGSGRSMVLDGANRTTALRQLGMPHTIAQVIDAKNNGLKLKKWNHVLWGWQPAALLEAIRQIPGVELHTIDPRIKRPQKRWPLKTLVWLQTTDGKAYIVRSIPSDLASRARQLALIAQTYIETAQVDRTTAQRISELEGLYENLTAIMVYPPFTVEQVLELCAQGALLPAGVTRFTIAPRALRLNYPLEALAANQELDTKNAALDAWINERMARKGVRYYAEPTVLYDE